MKVAEVQYTSYININSRRSGLSVHHDKSDYLKSRSSRRDKGQLRYLHQIFSSYGEIDRTPIF
jgi:hypothetical protein